MKKIKRILFSICALFMIGAIILCNSSEVKAFGASNLITGTGNIDKIYNEGQGKYMYMPIANLPDFYSSTPVAIENPNYGNRKQYISIRKKDDLKLAYMTMAGGYKDYDGELKLRIDHFFSFLSMNSYWGNHSTSGLQIGQEIDAFIEGREYGSRLTILQKFQLTAGEIYKFSCVAARGDGDTTADFYIIPHFFNKANFNEKMGNWAGKNDAPQIYEANDGDYVVFILRAANGDTSVGGGIDCAMVWDLNQMKMFEEDQKKAFQMSQYPIMNIIYKPFNYTVSKRLNGSSTTTFVKNYERYGVTELDINEIEKDVAIPEGYHLVGWEVKPTQTLTAEGQAVLNEVKGNTTYFSSDNLEKKLLNPNYYYSAMFQDVELVAVYEPNDYTVEFNSNIPNNNTTKTQTHTYGSSKTLLDNPFTYTGYTFSKWTRKADGTGTSYDDKATVSNLTTTKDGLVKLYAQWTINKSTLTVNPNGGTWNGSTASQSFTQNYNTTLSIPNPSDRVGYTFNGWTKSSTFTAGTLSGTTFTFGATKNGTGTLTANWDIHTSTITVNPNKV